MSIPFDVFISYPHENKPAADAACAALEAAGVKCWIAPRDVPPGGEWAAAIVEAIDRCRVMVLVFSSHSNQSKQVFREIQRAFDREAPVIPFRVENVNPERSLAYYMGSVHWLDAFTPPIEPHLLALVTSVKALMQAKVDLDGRSGPAKRSDAAVDQNRSPPVRPPLPPRAIWIAGGLCVLALGAFGLWITRPPSPPAPGANPAPSFPASSLQPLTAEREHALAQGDAFKECEKCPEMVVVPPGNFYMGSPIGEPERDIDEGPRHQVTFARAFAVGRFAVTFDDWDACVADGGCGGYVPESLGWGRGRRPAINISWSDARAYVAWLAAKTGKPYRLPSEAEREYVTRAGSASPYWWGPSITTDQANYDGNGSAQAAEGQQRGHTVPVDSFEPNPWGLYQVHGNIYEWTQDCWVSSYEGAPSDGSARMDGDCGLRVIRGGSWDYDPKFLRSASRLGWKPDTRAAWLGFRVARTLPGR